MMLNYDDIITQANERQRCLQIIAEQRQLAQSLGPSQRHPILVWVGQALIKWGLRLQDPKFKPVKADTLFT